MNKKINNIKVTSEIVSIKQVSTEILASLSPYKVDEDTLFDIRLCTEEAVRNAIEHGNNLKKEAIVKVRYWIDKDSLNIEVEDEGAGFDVRQVADPTDNSNKMKESGRGVYLIMKLMDYVEFNKKGNIIMMRKGLRGR